MYNVIDLQMNKTLSFSSKLDLLYWWKTKRIKSWPMSEKPLDFSELNVTGVDTHFDLVKTNELYFNSFTGTWLPLYKKILVRKRYHVVDKAGRAIDIREWANEIRMVNNGWHPDDKQDKKLHEVFRKTSCSQGAKDHSHRRGCKSMWRASVVQASLNHEDELDGYMPIVDKSKFRNRGFGPGNNWDSYEWYRHLKAFHSKSWKDQSKAGRQWARHKNGVTKRHLRQKECYMNCITEEDYFNMVMESIDLLHDDEPDYDRRQENDMDIQMNDDDTYINQAIEAISDTLDYNYNQHDACNF